MKKIKNENGAKDLASRETYKEEQDGNDVRASTGRCKQSGREPQQQDIRTDGQNLSETEK